MNISFNSYITSLSQVIQPAHQSATEPDIEPNSTLRPLLDRARDLLASIPDTVKADGLNLHELRVRLKGRQGRSASAQELGACLRTLGYQRYRGWSDLHRGFIARWYAVR